jgi:hydrophobic/amphiphilic exporter-1 (mainly G- bacteria), HAE1 family
MAKKKAVASSSSYFDRLSFDPQLLNSWIAKYIGNIRIVLLLILTICMLGMVSYFSLPKRLNPEVKIPIVTVVTILPGASPEDMESLVSEPLENKLKSLKGLDTITSSSRDNVSAITLQFQSSIDRDQALEEAQSAVNTFTDLPEDAQTPSVRALDFEDQPIWTFVLTSKGDERSLMSYARRMKQRIEDLSKVDRVVTNGFEQQEVVIAAQPEKVQQYGLNPLALSQAVKQALSSFPGGALETSNNRYSVTISPSVETVEDIRNLLINVQGSTVRLGEIATIEERSKLNQATTFMASKDQPAQRAVTFYVYKTSSVSIDDAGEEVETAVDELLAEQGSDFTLTTLSNTSEMINEQFSDLIKEFRSTIILVFVCIFLFLGLRQAIISSLTVPLTFLSAFVFMNVLGMSINFLSLFAFLLALGLLVDDTIVVIQAMTTYYRSGKFTPLQTGLLVWKDTIVPIWSTTLTTIWSFVPLLLTSGIIGEFIKPIPIVVTVTMISSTAIAVLITLPVMILILKPQIPDRVKLLGKILLVLLSLGLLIAFLGQNPLLPLIALIYVVLLVVTAIAAPILWQRGQLALTNQPWLIKAKQFLNRITDQGLINMHGFAEAYRRTIMRVISSQSSRRKVILAIVIYAVVCFALLPLGYVKNEFFPSSDEDLVYVSLEQPAGTTLHVTAEKAQQLLHDLSQYPEAEYVIAEMGKSQGGGFGGQEDTGNTALFSLHLPEKAHRAKTSTDISQELRTLYRDYPAGKVTIGEVSSGPPAGADLQINMLGSDLDQLNRYTDQVVEYLQAQPGISNVEKSIKSGTSQVKFIPDKNKLAAANIGVDSIGLWMRIYSSGFTLDSLNLDSNQSEETDIVFRLGTTTPTLEGLSKVSVTNNQGVSYPLLSLGELVTQANPTVINREDGSRTISVSAAVGPGYTTSEKNAELEAFADSLNLPDGYSWSTGGVNEENQKSINSILQAMGISAILILVTMVIQFSSFRQAFIVLIVIPLAVSSVFLVFALTGTPLSFPALIGILSLFGVVVTNSMFIVDKINLNKKEGMGLKESIADAGASRLEPILLTKLCTVLGLLPITIADPLWRGLGGAIISGLLISSTIMLLFIPVVYYSMFQHEDKPTKSAT